MPAPGTASNHYSEPKLQVLMLYQLCQLASVPHCSERTNRLIKTQGELQSADFRTRRPATAWQQTCHRAVI